MQSCSGSKEEDKRLSLCQIKMHWNYSGASQVSSVHICLYPIILILQAIHAILCNEVHIED